MSNLYVNGNGVVVGLEGNRCYAQYKDGLKTSIPIETLEGITIMGQAEVSVSCIQYCLKEGIPLAYYSKGGVYFGRLQSTGHINVERQRRQCALYQSEFALQLSKRIISGKLKNQYVVLRRYEKSKGKAESDCAKMIKICRNKVDTAKNISVLMGYEGQAAKAYFNGLAEVIEPEFSFRGRSKRPPKDEFNSMISLGYSVIMNEIYGKIEMKGLNPYFGFLHSDKEKHPTLASDMMEEWRAVIVDATVMSMINGHEIQKKDFSYQMEEPGCYLTKEGIKAFLNKLERKLQTEVKYLDYIPYSVSFRRAISLQLDCLVKAIENENASLYNPIEIR